MRCITQITQCISSTFMNNQLHCMVNNSLALPFWAASPIGNKVLENGEIFPPYACPPWLAAKLSWLALRPP